MWCSCEHNFLTTMSSDDGMIQPPSGGQMQASPQQQVYPSDSLYMLQRTINGMEEKGLQDRPRYAQLMAMANRAKAVPSPGIPSSPGRGPSPSMGPSSHGSGTPSPIMGPPHPPQGQAAVMNPQPQQAASPHPMGGGPPPQVLSPIQPNQLASSPHSMGPPAPPNNSVMGHMSPSQSSPMSVSMIQQQTAQPQSQSHQAGHGYPQSYGGLSPYQQQNPHLPPGQQMSLPGQPVGAGTVQGMNDQTQQGHLGYGHVGQINGPSGPHMEEGAQRPPQGPGTDPGSIPASGSLTQGTLGPSGQKASALTPSQMQQLRAQIMAYKFLARNQQIPDHIGMAVQGKRHLPPQPPYQRPTG
ncbi:uncharacterized protein LOC143257084 isoform X1 [Tachypleus tridentatus]|uniref:uncharacterized protein LOC143257084 isoform X1 n=3 Tax=Tachypleus tridentatus TaxID=6853 RepID=UPI003FD00262